MKLLITGYSGFIGKHVTAAAIERGWDVSGFDIAHPSENKRMDVRMLSRVEADVVLHLAGFASNAGFADRMAENYANNVMGMWNVLRVCQAAGARLVYASSSAVYGNWSASGDGSNLDLAEMIPVPQPSHYANSKRICEIMAASFQQAGVNSLGLRIFNAYGPGDELKPHPSPITQMEAAFEAAKPFVCYGHGTQAKDFIHVSDVAEIICRLIDSDATGIVNVGTGVATSFNDLARLIGCEMKYAPVPHLESYQFFTRADTSRLLSLIGPYKFKSVEEAVNHGN